MRTKDFKNAFGTIVEKKGTKWGNYLAFIPNPLPPNIEFNKELIIALSKADSSLSKLSGVGLLLPNPELLVTPYLRKEALSSSRIEGTRISLSEYFLAEARDEENKTLDSSEVLNYIESVNYALKEIETKDIDLKLIEKIHSILMKNVRGKDKLPRMLRPIQNWIGLSNSRPQDAIFVPPPEESVTPLMVDLINYINLYDDIPHLIKCALMHYQFETIHPFCDGNGRIGRALITLYLCNKNKISKPLLYISGFFEKYKMEYSRLLLKTNRTGEFQDWILFFLEAIAVQSEDALNKAISLQKLKETYRARVQEKTNSNTILKVLDDLFVNPYIQINKISRLYNVSYPTSKRIIDQLIDLNILKQKEISTRNKTYVAYEILDIIII